VVGSVTDALETMRRDRVQHDELDRLDGLLDEPWPGEPPGHQLHESVLTNGGAVPDRGEQEWGPSPR
jgi:hypothetical protein